MAESIDDFLNAFEAIAVPRLGRRKVSISVTEASYNWINRDDVSGVNPAMVEIIHTYRTKKGPLELYQELVPWSPVLKNSESLKREKFHQLKWDDVGFTGYRQVSLYVDSEKSKISSFGIVEESSKIGRWGKYEDKSYGEIIEEFLSYVGK